MPKIPAKFGTKDFLKELGDLASSLRQQIEAECSGFAPDPAASKERKAQAQNDFAFFRRTYFPHYTKYGDSILHTWLDDNLPRLVDLPAGQRLAVAAPRGEAKSTVVGLQFVLWCGVTGRKRYMLEIADAFEQAAAQLEAVKAELEANPRLALDFPEHCGQGRVWNAGVIITSGQVKIQAFGANKRMRGLRHGPHRPDLVICDDLENDENVKSPEQRDKLEKWLRRTVLSLGEAGDTMDVFVIGTVLHHDSVLSRLLAAPLWRHKKFRAILTWPDRMDLWDAWEETLLNEGEEAALAYYGEHLADMELGASVSWASARPLYSLMLKRARDGHDAFDSEQQNAPGSGDDAPFKVITFWVDIRHDWLFFGAVDPSLGKKGKSRDPSAILVGGWCRDTMTLDVVEASIRKRLPDRIIEDVLAMHAQYRCLLWAVEAVQFQEFLRTELIRRATERRMVIPAKAVVPHADKTLRIESLQPYFAQGRIRLHPSQSTLIEQFRNFPLADHDDGPDATHMLWEIAVGGFTTMAFDPVPKDSGPNSRNLWSGTDEDDDDY
jgi:predicted phage terminase large subunit-like protein